MRHARRRERVRMWPCFTPDLGYPEFAVDRTGFLDGSEVSTRCRTDGQITGPREVARRPSDAAKPPPTAPALSAVGHSFRFVEQYDHLPNWNSSNFVDLTLELFQSFLSTIDTAFAAIQMAFIRLSLQM